MNPYQRSMMLKGRGMWRVGEFFCAVVIPPLGFLFGIIGYFYNKRIDFEELAGWYIVVMVLSVIATIAQNTKAI